jgi:hypothetical protein
MKYEKIWHNPMDIIEKHLYGNNISHITYDENMKFGDRQYYMIKESTHDGTCLFTENILINLLIPLILKTTCFKHTKPADANILKTIKYTLGKIRHAIVFGNFDINGHVMYGQRESVIIPVRCEYVY